MPHIRPAQPQDLDELVLLLKSLFAIEADFTFDPHRQASALELLLASDSSLLLVAEVEDRVVGMCSGQTVISTAEGGPALLVEDLVVATSMRGRGIGRRLLKTMGGWAASRRIDRIQLLADRDNTGALDFYRNLGWQTTNLICLRTYIGNQ